MQPAINSGSATAAVRGSLRPWNCNTAASRDRYTPISKVLPRTMEKMSGMVPRNANSKCATALNSSPSAHH